MKLSDYVLLSREERTAHINLTSACVFDNGNTLSKSEITSFLGIEDDLPNWIAGKVHQCHLCECGRRKGNCRNPLHIYLGTASENCLDIPAEKRAERVEAMREANRGKKRTPEQLERITAGQKRALEEGLGIGWQHTDDAKELCRQAALRQHAEGLGAKWTNEQRAAHSERMSKLGQVRFISPITGLVSGKSGIGRSHKQLGITASPVLVPNAIENIVASGKGADHAYNLEVFDCWLSLAS